MMRVLFDDILSACESMGVVAVAKPWFSQAISKPATWKQFGLAIEPSLGGATESQAIAKLSRAMATQLPIQLAAVSTWILLWLRGLHNWPMSPNC